jgi:hypothetical protein
MLLDSIKNSQADIENRLLIEAIVEAKQDIEIIKKDLKYLFTKTWGELDVSCIVKFVIGGKKYVVSHYSLKVWEDSHKGVRNLYSHSHGTLPDDINSLSFDVGMDANNLQPLSFIEVEEIISKKTWKAIDHHNEQIKE